MKEKLREAIVNGLTITVNHLGNEKGYMLRFLFKNFSGQEGVIWWYHDDKRELEMAIGQILHILKEEVGKIYNYMVYHVIHITSNLGKVKELDS